MTTINPPSSHNRSPNNIVTRSQLIEHFLWTQGFLTIPQVSAGEATQPATFLDANNNPSNHMPGNAEQFLIGSSAAHPNNP